MRITGRKLALTSLVCAVLQIGARVEDVIKSLLDETGIRFACGSVGRKISGEERMFTNKQFCLKLFTCAKRLFYLKLGNISSMFS